MDRKYVALFAGGVLIFLNFVVPPFQSPDEPHHFAAAVLYARGEEARDAVESGVIGMMDRANWWRLVGLGRPSPRPTRIADVAFLMGGEKSVDFRMRLDRFVLWHRLAGLALRPFADWSLERLYFLCRLASAFFFAMALFFLWKSVRILAAVYGPIAKGSFFLVIFLPQYLLTGTAVSPDSFVLLLSAAFFSGAASLITGNPRVGQAAWIVIPAMIGLLTDRSVFVLVALVVLVPLFMMTQKNYRHVVFLTLLGAATIFVLVYAATQIFPLEIQRIFVSARYVLKNAAGAPAAMFKTDSFTLGYWSFIADSFLFKFGWQVFGAPKIIYWIWRMLLGGVGIGLIFQCIGWAKRRMRGRAAGDGIDGGVDRVAGPGRSATLRWTLFSIIAFGIQTVGVWVYYGFNHFFGQGRYFHPLIVPIALFAVMGLSGLGDLVKKGAGRMVVAGAIMAEFLLLAFSVWHDIVPVFHMILRGPNPGV